MAHKWTELEKTSNKTTEWGSLTSFVHSDEGFVSRLVNIDKETFVSKVIVSGTYQFKYVTTGEDGWYLNGELVDLAEYGVFPDTAPVDGHIIVVEYTAPSNTEYPSAKLVKESLDKIESDIAEGNIVINRASIASNADLAEVAVNSIEKSDGTHSGFYETDESVLKTENYIISKKIELADYSRTAEESADIKLYTDSNGQNIDGRWFEIQLGILADSDKGNNFATRAIKFKGELGNKTIYTNTYIDVIGGENRVYYDEVIAKVTADDPTTITIGHTHQYYKVGSSSITVQSHYLYVGKLYEIIE